MLQIYEGITKLKTRSGRMGIYGIKPTYKLPILPPASKTKNSWSVSHLSSDRRLLLIPDGTRS